MSVWSVSELDKRKWIQLAAAVLYNIDAKGFITGTVSRSPLKNVCVPGLNCYSCPGAVAACPLGSLQNTLAAGRFPFFVAGFLLFAGVVFGRAVCGFLCPFGFIQELLNKLPRLFAKTPEQKLRDKTAAVYRISRAASHIKYGVLAVFVVALPLVFYVRDGIGSPYFCKWICPAGTLEAGVPLMIANEMLRSAAGALFNWKVLVLAVTVIWSAAVYRPFCRYVCPLGALYSFFNRVAVFGVAVDTDKCTQCGRCVSSCRMDVRAVNDRECIRCGECIAQCPSGAIYMKTLKPASKQILKGRV